MELKVWSKTLLSIYKSLNNIADAIDKVVKATGLKRGGSCDSTFYQAQKMIELTERKKSLINIKCLIETTLVGLEQQSCKILVLKFFDKVKADDMASLLNISRRTVFRKINSAIQSFETQLLKKGYDANKICKILENETWVNEIYDQFLLEEEKKSCANFCLEDMNISAERLVNLAISSIHKVNKNRFLNFF